MRSQQPEKRNRSASALLGWLIFGAVIAGGPLLGVLQNAFGITLPSFTLPALIGLLMLISAIVSISQVMRRNDRATGWPDSEPTMHAPNAPMPTFGEGGASIPRFGMPPSPAPPPATSGPTRSSFPPDAIPPPVSRPKELRPPRFEPVFSAPAVLIGVVGLVMLAAVGVVLFVNVP